MTGRWITIRRPWLAVVVAGVLSLTSAVAATAQAQPPGPPPPSPHGPPGPPPHGPPPPMPFGDRLFPPELVMGHQGAIHLTTAQRKKFIKEVQALQNAVVSMQVKLQRNVEKLEKLLDGTRVDEAAVKAQAKKVASLESAIKTRHLVLLVRIKNLLTAKQQAALRRLGRRP